ncbi:MAG: FIVAR domain-containing protein [Bifidobacteriaceae bacterium]|jgi:hypothetical protein|nr:FIVAR domain-containing protein [Bifidobacteriaceae bacterium]
MSFRNASIHIPFRAALAGVLAVGLVGAVVPAPALAAPVAGPCDAQLVPVVEDAAAVNAAITCLENTTNYNPNTYTTSSWAAFLADIADARLMLTIGQPHLAMLDLQRAPNQLEERGDVSVLIPLLASGPAPEAESQYTPESWASYIATRNTVAYAIAHPDDTPALAILGLLLTFPAAVTSLVRATEPPPGANRAVLNAAIAQAEGLAPADFTPATWAALTAALTAAKAVPATATQAEVDSAAATLNAAITSLVPVVTPPPPPAGVDRTALDAAIAIAEALNSANFTPASWTPLTAALTAAKAVPIAATQPQVDAAAIALATAIGNLVTVPNETVPAGTPCAQLVVLVNPTATDVTAALTCLEGIDRAVYTTSSVYGINMMASLALYQTPLGFMENLATALGNLRLRGNTAALAALLAASPATADSGDYTSGTWGPYAAALAAAQAAIADNSDLTQLQVDKIAATFIIARSGLVSTTETVNWAALNALIAQATALTASDYTTDSWGALTTALNTATALPSTATQAQVDSAATALSTAIAGLVAAPPPVDRTALDALIAQAAALTESAYTASSWAPLASALAAARALATTATQAQVDSAATALSTAIAGLVLAPPPASRTILNALIAAVGGLTASNYTTASWTAVTTALAAANALPTTATQAQVDSAATALANAIGALALAPVQVDRSVLAAAIAAAGTLTAADYTSASWAALTSALATANALPTTATQAQVNAAAAAIVTAIGGLAPVAPAVDRSVLNAWIAAAGALTESNYTSASWAALANALAAANAVPAGATQAQVNTAATALADAITALAPEPPETPAVDRSVLDALIAAAQDLTASDYTSASWAAVIGALAAANAVPTTATQAQVNTAATALADAIGGLVVAAPETPAVDRTSLNALIAIGDSLSADAGAYTSASWGAVSSALTAAKAVPATAAQAQVDAAEATLATALAGLRLAGEDTSGPLAGLNALLATVAEYDPAAYTEATWQAVADAVAAATAVAANPAATQEQINAATIAVYAALAGLERLPGTGEPRSDIDQAKDALQAVLEIAAGSDPNAYTPSSWKSLTDAVAAARLLLADPTASVERIREVLIEVATAYGKLVLKALVPPTTTVVKVKAAQKAVTLIKGKSITIYATGYGVNGAKAKVTWKSSKKKVATVSKTGKVKAKRVGKATITATAANGIKAKFTVRVVKSKPAKATVTKVTVKGVPKKLKVGAVKYAVPTYKPATATSVKVKYSSSKKAVVTVDKAGRVVAKAKGKATLKVKAGKKTKKIKITVS